MLGTNWLLNTLTIELEFAGERRGAGCVPAPWFVGSIRLRMIAVSEWALKMDQSLREAAVKP